MRAFRHLFPTKMCNHLQRSPSNWTIHTWSSGEKRKATKRNTAMAKPQTPAVVKCCIYIQLPSLAADCVMAEHRTCHSTFHHCCCCIKSKTFDRKGITRVLGVKARLPSSALQVDLVQLSFINLKHPNNWMAWSTQSHAEFHAY